MRCLWSGVHDRPRAEVLQSCLLYPYAVWWKPWKWYSAGTVEQMKESHKIKAMKISRVYDECLYCTHGFWFSSGYILVVNFHVIVKYSSVLLSTLLYEITDSKTNICRKSCTGPNIQRANGCPKGVVSNTPAP